LYINVFRLYGSIHAQFRLYVFFKLGWFSLIKLQFILRAFTPRKYLQIDDASVHYIGQEANQLEESEIIGVDPSNYTIYEDPSLL